jgi:diguanylate cyclase (GGDEF)-like protein/PAS domain S-box-containing protein
VQNLTDAFRVRAQSYARRIFTESSQSARELKAAGYGELTVSPLPQSEPGRYPRPSVRSLAAHRRRIIRILFVNDNSNTTDVELCLQELKRAQFAVCADVVHTPQEFAERLRGQTYDVVLVAYTTPNRVEQPLELLRQEEREIPFILVTSFLDEEIIEEFVKKGACDCVDRNHLARLPLAVALAVEEKTLREDRNRTEKQLLHSEAHYHALVENPAYGICRFDVGGRFLVVNQALVAMLGYASREELLPLNLATDVIRDPVERAQLFEPYRHTGRIDRIEVEWKRKDGTPMKVRLSGREARSEQGVPDGCEMIVEDITEQRALEDQLRHLAATDALTGLANYRRLAEALEAEIRRSDRTGRKFGVLLFDLNGMKQINDRYGHLAGNRAICRLADIFRLSCRSLDTPARYGGDEFAIVLPETEPSEAGLVGRRICDHLANDGEAPPLSASVGLATYPENGETIENLLHAADQALYKSKGH